MDHIEIVSIGDELLSGMVVNTNAAYLCRELTELGLSVHASHVLPDERLTLRRRLTRVLQDSTLVIATGGLGPTLDDNTREVVAEIFNSSFRFDDGIAASLKERYGEDLASLHNQATVPSKAIIIPNENGTAPALLFEAKTVTLFLLPGVPHEMQAIYQSSIKPYLIHRLPNVGLKVQEHIIISGAREDDVDPLLRKLSEVTPELGIGLYPRPGALTVTLSAPHDDKLLLAVLESAKKNLASHFPDKAIVTTRASIQEAIHELFITHGITLSTAESCTGGAIAARLTSLPGASKYFLGSIVAYANEVKHDLLYVPQDILELKGAVSEETAIEMAKGALARIGSDYSVAVTGIAGPGGAGLQKPVGTVWVAVANKQGVVLSWHLRGRGTRANIIEYTINSALCRLWIAANKDAR